MVRPVVSTRDIVTEARLRGQATGQQRSFSSPQNSADDKWEESILQSGGRYQSPSLLQENLQAFDTIPTARDEEVKSSVKSPDWSISGSKNELEFEETLPSKESRASFLAQRSSAESKPSLQI